MEDNYRGRIVVGIDGSPHSERAARWAAREAVANGRGLTLLFAILPAVTSFTFGPGVPVSPNGIDVIRAAAGNELHLLAETLPCEDVLTALVIGAPSGALFDASLSAETIVVGSRGRGGFEGLLLGSVSAQISAHAQCPVVIIRDEPIVDARNIVVGLDGSPASQAALAFAFDQASTHGWHLVALHAWDIPSYDLLVFSDSSSPVALSRNIEDEIKLTAAALGGFTAKHPDVKVETRVIRGNTAEALVAAAYDAAMLVVGTRGHGRILGAIVGSVSRSVMHKSAVPIAVVPAS
jgi:nucleotide-binding universal stress UspA family protein